MVLGRGDAKDEQNFPVFNTVYYEERVGKVCRSYRPDVSEKVKTHKQFPGLNLQN